MSSINTRIAQLERRLGSRCPTCAHSHTRIELIGPPQQGRQADPEPCPECGQAGDLIVVGLSFDPNTDHPKRQPDPAAER